MLESFIKRTELMIDKFRANWKNYIFQSLLATAVIFVIFLILTLRQAVIIASLGATAFIIFAMPSYVTAKSRNVIGGHLVGLACGAIFFTIGKSFFLHQALVYSLAVGLSIFIMVVTDTEHPPASGTALGVAINGISLTVAATVILSAVLLSATRHVLKPYLKDLT